MQKAVGLTSKGKKKKLKIINILFVICYLFEECYYFDFRILFLIINNNQSLVS